MGVTSPVTLSSPDAARTAGFGRKETVTKLLDWNSGSGHGEGLVDFHVASTPDDAQASEDLLEIISFRMKES